MWEQLVPDIDERYERCPSCVARIADCDVPEWFVHHLIAPVERETGMCVGCAAVPFGDE